MASQVKRGHPEFALHPADTVFPSRARGCWLSPLAKELAGAAGEVVLRPRLPARAPMVPLCRLRHRRAPAGPNCRHHRHGDKRTLWSDSAGTPDDVD